MSTIINATTTNGVVIQPDNSGSLVLQTNNGTTALTIDTSQNITTTNKLASASMPAGSILQIVQASSAGGSTASTSFTDMGLSASITPTKNTSKILVQVNGITRATVVLRAGFSIVRGSTNIQSATEYVILPSANLTNNSYYLTVLDSPATTSSTTYKVQFQTNTGTVYTNDAGTVAAGNINYITLFEVAA